MSKTEDLLERIVKLLTPKTPAQGKCKGSFYQERSVNIEQMGIGGKLLILRHAECDCNTGCRRVTLWHPRPKNIDLLDDYVVKPIARVRWGDGCGGPEVEVDWKHGVILDLSGCYDEVSLEIAEILGSPPDEDSLFRFGVLSACCGAGAARGCATRTTALVTVEDGVPNTVMVPIPPFAYAVSFAPQVASQAAFFTANMIMAQSGSGAIPPGLMMNQTGADMQDPWMLVGGAETIVLTNVTGNNIAVELVFHIGV